MRLDIKGYVEEKKKELGSVSKSLLIVQAGDDSASNAYIKGKMNDCRKAGINVMLTKFPEGSLYEVVFETLKQLIPNYNAVIIQEPFDKYVKKFDFQSLPDVQSYLVKASQDVDGFNKDSKHLPCTPLGIVNYLKYCLKVDNFRGLTVGVMGQGRLVGQPLAKMLVDEHATVFSLNSKTKDKKELLRRCDIVIAGTGIPGILTRDMLKDNAIVMDAGIAFDENGKMCGDCDKSLYDDESVLVSTVPGGVGLLTRLTLMENISRS